MKAEDIVFDEDDCINDIVVEGQKSPVTLVVSDVLDASDEILLQEYRERIASFVNAASEWLPIARDRVMREVGNDGGLQLMTIYVLFEQDAQNSLYGLLFNLDSDREHGRGMMLHGEGFEILKYGDASVAFEGR